MLIAENHSFRGSVDRPTRWNTNRRPRDLLPFLSNVGALKTTRVPGNEHGKKTKKKKKKERKEEK